MATNIVVPEMGESIVDARVSRWLKNEGDRVAAGEAIVELETDKVDVEVSAPQSGVLETIAHGAGSDVKIGEVLGRIGAGAMARRRARQDGRARRRGETGPGCRGDALCPQSRARAARSPERREDGRAAGDEGRCGEVPAAGSGRGTAGTLEPRHRPRIRRRRRSAGPGDRTETRVRMSKRRATIARRLVEAQQTAACSPPSTRST